VNKIPRLSPLQEPEGWVSFGVSLWCEACVVSRRCNSYRLRSCGCVCGSSPRGLWGRATVYTMYAPGCLIATPLLTLVTGFSSHSLPLTSDMSTPDKRREYPWQVSWTVRQVTEPGTTSHSLPLTSDVSTPDKSRERWDKSLNQGQQVTVYPWQTTWVPLTSDVSTPDKSRERWDKSLKQGQQVTVYPWQTTWAPLTSLVNGETSHWIRDNKSQFTPDKRREYPWQVSRRVLRLVYTESTW
jgi:hypothetical protein